MTLEELKAEAKKLGYLLVKVVPGSGWHPDDGPCCACGVEEGEDCKEDCPGLEYYDLEYEFLLTSGWNTSSY